MKLTFILTAGLMLLLAPFAGAAVVTNTVFWDDLEGEAHNEPDPTADIGFWGDFAGSENGIVVEVGIIGIPAPPGGGTNVLQVTNEGAGNTWARTPPLAGVGNSVHAEWDYYAVDNGQDYFVYGLLANTNHLTSGRNDSGWAPNIQDRGPDPNFPDLVSMYNDVPNWLDGGMTPSIPKPARGVWHHYEIDFTIGDDTSMFLTVDGGTPANLPGPWGWDALGNTGHPDSRGTVDEMWGAVWYNNAGPAVQYVDNVLITFAETGLEIASFEVTTKEALSFPSELGLVYQVEYSLLPATDIWQSTGFSVPGNGGTMFAFDPSEPSGSSTTKVYRAVAGAPAP